MSIDYKKMTTVNSSRKTLAPIETVTPQQAKKSQESVAASKGARSNSG
jgi:hypothetical protein